MRALVCNTFGPPETLVIEQARDPVAAAGQVIVDTHFAGLNFFDTLIIENKYQVKPPLPFSPGGEFSGIVSALGAGVTAIRAGDRVAGYCGYGAARGRIACPADQLFILPPHLSLEKAAGLTVTYGTTLHALAQRADLADGETLAVLGASGGVGIAAVEIGKLLGAQVIACASSPDKVAFAMASGAAQGIDYSVQDLKEELKRLTQGRGVDIVYDPVGGNLTEPALRALAWKGRLLVIGFAAGPIPKIPLNLVLLKGCDIRGVFWGEFIRREPAVNRANMAKIFDWAASGAVSAPIHAILPLDEAAAAMGLLSGRKALGKVLLRL